jgi:hypothetical protein
MVVARQPHRRRTRFTAVSSSARSPIAVVGNGSLFRPRRIWARRTRLAVYGSFDAVTFSLGIMAECLGGIETGHRELPGWIDRWMDR